MNTAMQSVSDADIRPLEASEIDDVSGGLLGILGGLFAAGFAIGVVAYNVTHNRPWYEF
jgi:hypothetical protein